MHLLRLFLYCLSSLVGVVGLCVGGFLVVLVVAARLSGGSTSVAREEFFQRAVIMFLSLILLILVHIGYRLAGAFDMRLPKDETTEDSPKRVEV